MGSRKTCTNVLNVELHHIESALHIGQIIVWWENSYHIFLDVKIVFDTDNMITGLWFIPTEVTVEYEPPEYADLNSFTELNITIGSEEWLLPGTLTIPTVSKLSPVVILVHGSGPNDRDETIGPNKPFKDLAWGLATRGIAVLRYEKRTSEHSEKIVEILELTNSGQNWM